MKYTEQQIREMVLQYLSTDQPHEDVKGLSERCYYSLIEGYVPDCPGQCGDILTVVYGYITAIEVFLIKDNKLYPLESEIKL